MNRTTALVALVLVGGALVALPVSPVQLSYVTSDSMAPTIETNEGYVTVPAGTIEAGDVITFYSTARGGYVTHRAIAVTAEGIVTQGDANPSTDQAAGYPLVQPSSVTGKALEFDGSVLVVPHLGTLLSLLETYWYAVVALVVGAILYSGARATRGRDRDEILLGREILLTTVLVAVVVGTALVSLAAVHQTQVYQVVESDTDNPDVLPVGESRTESFTIDIAQTPLTHLVTDVSGMALAEPIAAGRGESRVGEGVVSSEQTVDATIPAQQTTGIHQAALHVYPYPATLPGGVVTTLHGIHPLVAAFTTVLAAILPLYGVYWALVDLRTPLRSTRSRLLRRLGGNS